MPELLLEVKNVSKCFQEGSVDTQVLKDVDLQVFKGEQLAIVGTSGSGKSTLLHIMGTLDRPTSGSVIMLGEDLYGLSARRQSEVRNQDLGFIYQFHHLLPEFTALENVAMPALIQGRNRKEVEAEAKVLLERVGLGHRLTHTPAEMSGGERQRTAIARALINKPKLVLADEPTGNLDASSGEAVYELIQELANQLGTAFVVVTHDTKLAARMDRQVQMKDGYLQPYIIADIKGKAL
ncbi:lipoprotein-releasing ABC transporter ATP-binding protein LolD [Shewanella sp. D64]|uniref:lipoprotein-releasing ABC transporter ATP-binding protein LolD n=1 Tax=unclassified Shewanella TaxID=196818 RepID=UPI0022BA3627|nr:MULTISPECIES: lipoprotein-releasing ABC transporter ATP-binding protein LolD [unclassified Shewanella]MEC4725689.1 lipoprotein-releasing ABC transporter ATP-binding protein LolD [Shewanella sp. D64]MEC4737704.1 lipoprotein-releasing ABC transporter ATP-binding protein LolD [Shewanella sp. E94]WBJ98206.1 lipoprotein-releasing ABC transporter ATP-binding protein LolD [Shewanella sp. MTB7]